MYDYVHILLWTTTKAKEYILVLIDHIEWSTLPFSRHCLYEPKIKLSPAVETVHAF